MRPWKGHKSPRRRVQRDDYHSDCQSYRRDAGKMSAPAQNRLKLDQFTHHADKEHAWRISSRRPPLRCAERDAAQGRKCGDAHLGAHPAPRRRHFSRRNAASAVEHWSERLDSV
jgi:hypothetical protein